MSRKAEYKLHGPWVQVRRDLPETSLVLQPGEQNFDPDLMRFIVEAVGPDVEYTLEPGTEVWLTPGVNAVGTLDENVYFIRAEQIVASVERIPESSLIQ